MNDRSLFPHRSLVCLFALAIAPLQAAPDTVDTTFAATAGQVFDTTEYGGVSSVLVQPDGRIVFGSNEMPGTVAGSPLNLPLIRFNPDGTVDNTFFADNDPNGSGLGIYFDGQGWPEIHALGIDSSGKIIAAGVLQGMRDGTNSLASNSIVRINTDGSLDTTFVTAGTTPGDGFNFIEEVTVQPDDKIIAVGGFGGVRDSFSLPSVRRYGIARFNTNGSLDTTFAIDPAEFPVPAGAVNLSGFFRQASLDGNGNIYIVGEFSWGTSYPRESVKVFARLFPNGRRDFSFNPSVPSNVSYLIGCVVEPDGNIVVLGESGSSASWMTRVQPSGASAGNFTLDPSLGRVTARPLQPSPDGKYILITGNSTSAPQTNLIRVNANGSLDPSFNAVSSFINGPTGPGTGYFGNFAISSSGKIYAGSFFDTVNGVGTKKLVAFEGDAVPNAPGTIQFAAHAFSATEQSGSARITVTRTGGTTGPASATFSIAPFTASAADYSPTTVTVNFPAGVGGAKYVDVPITTDALVESIEVANLTLTAITGASAGTLTSAYLSIIDSNSPPQIILQPQTLYIPPFQSFILTVGAISGKEPTTYQWFKNGSLIPGATSPLYLITSADPALHNGNYSVEVTNPNGTTPSSVASVTVKNPAVLGFTSATATAVENDGTLTLTLQRSGSDVGPVSIDVALIPGTATSPADFTAATTTVSWANGDTADKTVSIVLTNDATAESPEAFQAVLSNPSLDAIPGTITSVAITLLDDDSGPAITTPLASKRVVTGWNSSFSVTVQSQTSVSYEWFKDGVLIPGENNATLSFEPVTLADFGYYSVSATNTAGTVTSGPVELGARPNPVDRVALDLSISSNQFSGIRQRSDGTYLIFGAFTSVPTASGTLNIGRLIRTLPNGSVDPSFNLNPNSTVTTALELPDGSLILAGGFSQIGGVPTPGPLTRVLANGNVDTDFVANLPSGLGSFRDLDLGPDGKIYFTHANGIDRLNPDGTYEAAFRANSIASFEPFVNFLKLEFGPGGSLYLAGRFQLPGLGFRNLVKLNPDGTLDPTWKFTYGSSTFTNIGLQPDGKLIVPGSSSGQLIRLLPDGTTDPTFTAITGVYNQTFGVAADGSIYTAFSSNSNTRLRRHLPNGILDTSFNGGAEVALNGSISSITPMPDGSISIDGSFSTFNGASASRPYLINAEKQGIAITSQPLTQVVDPGSDVTLRVIATSVTPLTYQWFKNGTSLPGQTLPTLQLSSVSAADTADYSVEITAGSLSTTSQVASLTVRDQPVVLATPADRTLLIGNPLELTVDWVGIAPATFEWFRNGSPVPGQSTATLSIPAPTATDSGLYTLRITNPLGVTTSIPIAVNIIPDPAALASGFVPATSGTPNINHIIPEDDGAYLYGSFFLTHPSGSLNSYFERIDSNGAIKEPFTVSSNQQAQALARDSAGRLVLVGFNFFLDGGSKRVARIAADGTTDATFNTNAASSFFSSPTTIAIDSSDRPVVGGSNFLARLQADGTLDPGFSANPGFSVIKVRIAPDGKIYALGSTKLVRFDDTGAVDPTFTLDPAIPASPTFSHFDLTSDGKITIAASAFTNQTIYRVSSSGALEATIPFNYSTYSNINNIATLPDGSTMVAHSLPPRLTRLLPNGTPDPLFNVGTGFNSTVGPIAPAADGSLWVGGSFTQYKGSNAYGYVRLSGLPLDVILSTQPTPQITDAGETATFIVSATASGGASLSYLWRKNGIPLTDGGDISGATTDTLSIANSQDTDEASYDVIVTNLTTGRPYVSNPASLLVLREPEFLATSSAQALEVGDSLNLSIEARGAGTLGYQWFRNGEPIFGENDANLAISPVQESDTATYTVEISNAYGTFSSVDIPITVTLPAGGIRYTTPQITFGTSVNAILPLPDGRTLVGGYFTNVITNSTNHNIGGLALLDEDGALVTTYNISASSVDTLALMPDGGVLVGGNFTFISGNSRSRLARLKPDLTLDTDWTPGTGANSRVTCIAPAPSGYYLGGQFTSFNGDTSLAYVCRILPNGSPDPTFTPHSPLGIINDLKADGDGVIVGGNLTVPNPITGTNQLGILRLRGNGSHDTSFTSSFNSSVNIYSIAAMPDGKWLAGGASGQLRRFLPDGSHDTSWATTANQNIRSIAVQRDGRIVIAGNFTSIGGVTTNRICRLFPSGSVDASFAQGTGADGEILTLAQSALGTLHIGGSFNNYRSLQRGRYAELNGNPASIGIAIQPIGQVANPGDTAQFSITAIATDSISYQWRKNGEPLSNSSDFSGVDTPTLSIANVEDADAGSYDVLVTHNGDATTLTSTSAGLIVLGAPEILTAPSPVTTEVGLNATFRVVARGVSPLSYQWYRGTTPLADGPAIAGATTPELVLSNLTVADSANIKVRITNPIDFIESTPVPLLVEKLPAARDRSIFLPVSVNTTINDVVPFADGSYLIAGNFTSVSHTNGSASRRYLAKFNADGSLDTTVPQVNGTGTIEILAQAPDGKIYLGGSFTTLSTPSGNLSRTRIARLNADLTLDETFAVEGTGPNSTVRTVLPLANDKVLIGGQFNSVNSTAGTAYLCLLESDGSIDPSFTSLANTTVNDIASAGDGTYWLSHASSYGGQQRIVRITATGAIAPGFSYTSNVSSVRVSPQSDGSVISLASYGVQKVEASGAFVSGWAGGGNYLSLSNGSAITTTADGTLYLGGNFTSIYLGTSVTRNRILALESDGSLIDEFDPGTGLNGSPNRIRTDAEGRVWLVGGFTTYRGESVPYMVVLNGLGAGVADPFETFTASLPSGQQGENDDPDFDGWPNLIEFLFGTNPGNGSNAPAPLPTGSTPSGASLNATHGLSLDPLKSYRFLEIEIPTNLMGLTVDLEASQDLSFSGDAIATEIGTPTNNGSTETRRYYITPAIEDAPNLFWRLKANR